MVSDELEKQIRESWDQTYRNYPNEDLPWETFKPESTLVEILSKKLIKLGKVLDIGSGLGTHSIYLAENGFDVTAIDISPTAVEKAKKRAEEKKVKVKFQVGNGYDLKFENNFFDFVFDRGCFHHIPSHLRGKYAKGVHRVLKNGGKYLLLTFSSRNKEDWMNKFSPDDILKIFGGLFKILQSKEIVHSEPLGRKVILLSTFMEKISKE